MAPDALLHVGLSVEDELHHSLAVWLGRRAVLARATALGQDWVADYHPVVFRAAEGNGTFSKWAGARARWKAALPTGGRRPFVDEAAELRKDPRAAEYAAAVRLAEVQPDRVEMIVILDDTDGDHEHATSMTAAKRWNANRFDAKIRGLAILAPHQESETWLIAGLSHDARATARRVVLTKALGVDPFKEPERLPSSVDQSPRDPKRVLACILAESGIPEDYPSKPPPPDHEPLIERAFRSFEQLLASDLAERTGLRAAWDELVRELATRAVPGPP